MPGVGFLRRESRAPEAAAAGFGEGRKRRAGIGEGEDDLTVGGLAGGVFVAMLEGLRLRLFGGGVAKGAAGRKRAFRQGDGTGMFAQCRGDGDGSAVGEAIMPGGVFHAGGGAAAGAGLVVEVAGILLAELAAIIKTGGEGRGRGSGEQAE